MNEENILSAVTVSVSKIVIQQVSNVPSSVDEKTQVLLFVIFRVN